MKCPRCSGKMDEYLSGYECWGCDVYVPKKEPKDIHIVGART